MSSSAASATCTNCGVAVAAHFCAHCGQRSPTQRLTLGHILHEIPHAVFHVDRGFFPTLYALAVRPGRTIRDYLDGRRIRYFNPLTLLVIIGGLCALAYTKLPITYEPFALHLRPDIREPYTRAMQALFEFYTLLLMLNLPIAAAVNSLLFARRGRVYGEHLVANAFIFAFVGVISLAIIPAYVLAARGDAFITVVAYSFLPILLYQFIATYAAFSRPESKVADLLRAFFATLLSNVLFLMLYSLIGGMYIGFHAKAAG